ncbi:hypothetical protein D3C81_493370 [compost metagenome]
MIHLLSTASHRSRKKRSPCSRTAIDSSTAAFCRAGCGSSTASGCGRGCRGGEASSARRSAASASGVDHSQVNGSSVAGSLACTRQRSAASSSSSSRSLASSSGGSKVCPLSSACSRSTRVQKPWMVKIAARSISSAATCKRRFNALALSVPSCRWRCSTCRVSTASGVSSSPGGRSTRRAARARRSRMRLRSSWVAASVNVTARIWPIRRPCSTTRRVNSVARVKVLPVPALASISRVPCSGNAR